MFDHEQRDNLRLNEFLVIRRAGDAKYLAEIHDGDLVWSDKVNHARKHETSDGVLRDVIAIGAAYQKTGRSVPRLTLEVVVKSAWKVVACFSVRPKG